MYTLTIYQILIQFYMFILSFLGTLCISTSCLCILCTFLHKISQKKNNNNKIPQEIYENQQAHYDANLPSALVMSSSDKVLKVQCVASFIALQTNRSSETRDELKKKFLSQLTYLVAFCCHTDATEQPKNVVKVTPEFLQIATSWHSVPHARGM